MKNIQWMYFLFLLLIVPLSVSAFVSPWSDLTVGQISAPLTGTPGYPYEINVSVENHGNATSGLISVGFYLSEDDHLSKNDTFIQVTTGDPVAPGTGVLLYSIDTLPLTIAPGEYRLFAYVEDHEGDEQHLIDNTALLTALVQIKVKNIPETDEIGTEAARIIFELTNEARSEEGLPPFKWDVHLATIAKNYSDQMVVQKFFSHTDPNGHDQSYRAKAAGYNTVKDIEGGQRLGVAENIAFIGTGNVAGFGYVNPTDPSSIASTLMDGWMKSKGHRANILDPLSDRIGVGLSYNGEYWYATQEFY
ncbi:MAG: hypothetical protein CVV33_06420 [Methanomicrobiales archaeon HGW-Methanomicrobiales-4]|nr:MAG: hypothetical protein CVV33_06420 [Methanomicrobiales archaeon HGW-Methanomicrobiales-4]